MKLKLVLPITKMGDEICRGDHILAWYWHVPIVLRLKRDKNIFFTVNKPWNNSSNTASWRAIDYKRCKTNIAVKRRINARWSYRDEGRIRRDLLVWLVDLLLVRAVNTMYDGLTCTRVNTSVVWWTIVYPLGSKSTEHYCNLRFYTKVLHILIEIQATFY